MICDISISISGLLPHFACNTKRRLDAAGDAIRLREP